MADELTISISALFNKDPASPIPINYGSAGIDVSGDENQKSILSVTDTPAAIPLGGVTTPGVFIGKNLSDTVTILIQDGGAGTPFQKVSPGGIFVYEFFEDVVPYAVVESGAAELEYLIHEA